MSATDRQVDAAVDRMLVEAQWCDPGEVVTDVVVLIASVNASEPGRTRYGYISSGTMPYHHLIGLVTETADRIKQDRFEARDGSGD